MLPSFPFNPKLKVPSSLILACSPGGKCPFASTHPLMCFQFLLFSYCAYCWQQYWGEGGAFLALSFIRLENFCFSQFLGSFPLFSGSSCPKWNLIFYNIVQILGIFFPQSVFCLQDLLWVPWMAKIDPLFLSCQFLAQSFLSQCSVLFWVVSMSSFDKDKEVLSVFLYEFLFSQGVFGGLFFGSVLLQTTNFGRLVPKDVL